MQVDLKGNPESQLEIDDVFSLRAPPQPLDIITEANMRVCRLAPLDEEGATGKRGAAGEESAVGKEGATGETWVVVALLD